MFYCNLFSSHERAGDDAVLTEKRTRMMISKLVPHFIIILWYCTHVLGKHRDIENIQKKWGNVFSHRSKKKMHFKEVQFH